MKKVVFTLAAVLVASLSMAQSNFSGTWKLNTTKTPQTEMSFAPTSMVITQGENSLTIESVSNMMGQETKSSSKYTLDGKESVNTGMMDMQQKSTAVWSADKTTLTITSKMEMPGMDGGQGQSMTTTATYKLNGGSLEVENAFSMPNMPDGGMKTKSVYDK
jgi:hypothetical protein